ncbi:hypothetical protein [Amycolatopsis sp. NPDC000740]|uniref:hypothetical protein n=1 Tax=Amycolatopsis sp. NPDC000740 TaxID=3154269 RepID=UPI00332AB19E
MNLADPRTFESDLTEFWRSTRADSPVYRHEPHGFWVVSRHADVLAVYRDAAHYTSERGNVLVTLLAGETPRPAACSRSPTARATANSARSCNAPSPPRRSPDSLAKSAGTRAP